MEKNFEELEKKISIRFKQQQLLRQAFIHRSYLNEHREFPLDHNERLEFLGDAVLELIVTEHMFRKYPNPEGELTNWRASLVNSQSLGEIANELELNEYLYLSKGEESDKNGKARQSILANTLESLIGAIYLDQGMKSAQKFVTTFILYRLETIIEKKLYIDPKSRFQEASQQYLGITPTYKVIKEEGPDHFKAFTIGIFCDHELIATGEGSSKQEAQVNAAIKGLEFKGW